MALKPKDGNGEEGSSLRKQRASSSSSKMNSMVRIYVCLHMITSFLMYLACSCLLQNENRLKNRHLIFEGKIGLHSQHHKSERLSFHLTLMGHNR